MANPLLYHYTPSRQVAADASYGGWAHWSGLQCLPQRPGRGVDLCGSALFFHLGGWSKVGFSHEKW